MQEIMKQRHSVRSYTDRKIEGQTRSELLNLIEECNKESGLHIQACFDEEEAFGGLSAHYGKFKNVKNYIALVGKKDENLDEKCGYYGEKIVLKAQEAGLNTCWVAATYSKSKCRCAVEKGEKLVCVIAIGYGAVQGTAHKSKSADEVSAADGAAPEWFKEGVEAALSAPTALNQQKFMLTLSGNKVSAKAGIGMYTKLDLGIVKYHFELGAGRENFVWEQ